MAFDPIIEETYNNDIDPIPADLEEEVFTDGKDQASLLMQQKIDRFSNGLLGDFSAEGAYTIPDKIVKELVSMVKVVSDKNEDVYYLVAKSGTEGEEFAIKFVLTIESEEALQTATLKVVEKIDRANGIASNTLTSFVAKYTDDANQYFITKTFAIFNIMTDGSDSQMLEMNSKLAPSIFTLKKMHRMMKFKLASMSSVDKQFLEARIALLKKSGSYGAFVLRQLATLVKENGGKIPLKTESKYFRVMNELLDACFEKAGPFKNAQMKADFEKINSVFRDAVQKAESTIVLSDKKTEKTKSPADLGAPKSDSKGDKGKDSGGGGKDSAKGGKDSGGGGKKDDKISTLGQYLQDKPFNQPQKDNKPAPTSEAVQGSSPAPKPEISVFQTIIKDFEKTRKEIKVMLEVKEQDAYQGVNTANTFGEPAKSASKSKNQGFEK